jgi:hypothetical protein
MMNARGFAVSTLSVVAVLLSMSARAETVAGWDFSQYFTDGVRSTNGLSTTNTLDANYSSLDPTGNAGAESAAFGTLTIAGNAIPSAGSLQSNRKAPADVIGENSFDSLRTLEFEGQLFQELMSMTAVGSSTLVFATDLSSEGQTGSGWSVSFGGKTFDALSCTPNCTSTVTVEFSPDGSSYTSYGSVVLGTDDTEYSVTLDAAESAQGFVRLGLDPTSGQPIIDNVAVKVTKLPEPGLALGVLTGSLFLAAVRRRRA